VSVSWKEDVRVWHPGQHWIWTAGGLGVFDPGINALSILTHILPAPLILREARLAFPSNCDTPVAASLKMQCNGKPVLMELDFLQPGPPGWDIDITTAAGPIRLSKGGAVLRVGNDAPIEAPDREYAKLYELVGNLVRERRIDVDCAPLRLVADAFLCGRRTIVAPFDP
jgi:D-galactose 1-dehydrogenase